MNTIQITLAALTVSLIACSNTPSTGSDEQAQLFINQLDTLSPARAYSVDFIAQERVNHCNATYTKKELERLNKTDYMVALTTSFKTYVTPDEFPAFVTAIKKTRDCDSDQWAKDVKAYLSNSMEFKADIDARRINMAKGKNMTLVESL